MDLHIMAVLANRQRFKNLRDAVPDQMISGDAAVMLQWYGAYFDTFPEHKDIDWGSMASLVHMRSQRQTDEQKAMTALLLRKLQEPVSPDIVNGLAGQLIELDFAGKAGALLERYHNNGELDISYELQMLAAKTTRMKADGGKANWADGNILDYLRLEEDEGGLQWDLLPSLRANLRGVQLGDNIGLAAPTDKGKTSLICALVNVFQKQAKELHPGRPSLILVNEGTQERVTNRMYGTVAGVARDELWKMAESGELQRVFAEEMGGRDMVRVANIHGKNTAQVQRIIEQHNPHLVVTDMTGRIRASSNKGGAANDFSQLEEVWNDMREMAAIQQFAHMGTVQVSVEGFNQMHPPLSAVQNSKTGIQTTWDLGLFMGALTNPDTQDLRGISTPKNKLARAGRKSHQMLTAHFDAGPNVWTEYSV
jgi:hypothetical protein